MRAHFTKVFKLLNFTTGWTFHTWGTWGDQSRLWGRQILYQMGTWSSLLTLGSQQYREPLPTEVWSEMASRVRGGRRTPFFWLLTSIISYPQLCTPEVLGLESFFITHSAANLTWCEALYRLFLKNLISCECVLLKKYCVRGGALDSSVCHIITTYALHCLSKIWKLLNSETNELSVFGLCACCRFSLYGFNVAKLLTIMSLGNVKRNNIFLLIALLQQCVFEMIYKSI